MSNPYNKYHHVPSSPYLPYSRTSSAPTSGVTAPSRPDLPSRAFPQQAHAAPLAQILNPGLSPSFTRTAPYPVAGSPLDASVRSVQPTPSVASSPRRITPHSEGTSTEVTSLSSQTPSISSPYPLRQQTMYPVSTTPFLPGQTQTASLGVNRTPSMQNPRTAFQAPVARAGGGNTSRYQLCVIQQPVAARACGFGERDRRVVDPPPVVQMVLQGYNPQLPSDVAELGNTMLVVSTALLDAENGADVTKTYLPNHPGKESRQLTGSLVASPVVAPDLNLPAPTVKNGNLKSHFIFPDLSCRSTGKYRLQFTLTKVSPTLLQAGGVQGSLAQVQSGVFEVFSAKDFPGMSRSTHLTTHLKSHGAHVSVKKGNENRSRRSPAMSATAEGQSQSSREEGEEMNEDEAAQVDAED